MSSFLLNPLSINYLVEILLVVVLLVFFINKLINDIRVKRKSSVSSALCVVFFSLLVFLSLQFLKVSLVPELRHYVMPWISPFGAIAMCAFAVFSNNYLSYRPKKLENNLLLLFAVSTIIIELWVAFERHKFLSQGFVEYRPAWMDLVFLLGFFYILSCFFRNFIYALNFTSSFTLIKIVKYSLVKLFSFTNRIEPDVEAARAFMFVSLFPIFIAVVLFLRTKGLLETGFSELLICWLFLFTLTAFTFCYLNFLPEQSSFRIKLVGITLTTVLSSFCGFSWLIEPIYIDAFSGRTTLQTEKAFRLSPNLNGGYTESEINYSFDFDLGEKFSEPLSVQGMPFSFPFFGKDFNKVYPQPAGFISFIESPVWRDMRHNYGPQPSIFVATPILNEMTVTRLNQDIKFSEVYIRKTESRLIVTWKSAIGVLSHEKEYAFQLILHSSGAIDFVYSKLPQDYSEYAKEYKSIPVLTGVSPGFGEGRIVHVNFNSLNKVNGQLNEGLIENNRLNFLFYLNSLYLAIACFVLLVSLFILGVFPVFFKVNIGKPLALLLKAVQSMRNGQLSSQSPIVYPDEIGYLSASFNQLASDQRQLISTLEKQVEQRTAEATIYASKNARLEERNHLSQELHDTVSQTLFSANLIVDTLPELWVVEPEKAKDALLEIRKLNKSALSEMRQLLLELRPTKITEAPFSELVLELCSSFEAQSGINTTFITESDIILAPQIQVTFYRILQECFNNIAKHSQASEIEIYFDGVATQALLSVSDNGKGFKPTEMSDGHLGLQIMKERIEKIGGTLELDTSIDLGTKITLIWFEHD